MTMNAFNLFLGIMSLIALIVFIALYFVKAGYGIFRTASLTPRVETAFDEWQVF